MMIRKAKLNDGQSIRSLLDQLGYPHPIEMIEYKLSQLLKTDCDEIFVYENESKVVAFISLHYSIQMAYEKDFCEIGYFVVDENIRSQKIGNKLESYACQRAIERGCGDIFVYSSLKRKDAHRFYERQGYNQTEKYFEKRL